jgi:YesN/AraC family two-component response regulator
MSLSSRLLHTFLNSIHLSHIGILHHSHIFRIFSVISSVVFISLKLYIRYMVSVRCKMVVKDELTKLGLQYRSVELGEADLLQSISQEQRQQFRAALLTSGLELMDDKKAVLIQKIRTIIIELVHYSEEPLSINLSVYLAEKLQHDYTYLANLFSEVQGTTIEKFFISHKIERVKELLVYSELTLAEISYKMHYSSVAHLCTQFKKVTGLTPSHFKSL